MGGWRPDRVVTIREECDYFFCNALLWIVPARVDGTWTIDNGGASAELALKQQFQTFTGAMKTANGAIPVANGRLTGSEITFTADGVDYSGNVTGETIEGTTKSGNTWRARRGT
jgi:hypothetical protein